MFEGRWRSLNGGGCRDVLRYSAVDGYSKRFLVCWSRKAFDGRSRRRRRGSRSIDIGSGLFVVGKGPRERFDWGFVARLVSGNIGLRPRILRLAIGLIPLYNRCYTRVQRTCQAALAGGETDRQKSHHIYSAGQRRYLRTAYRIPWVLYRTRR